MAKMAMLRRYASSVVSSYLCVLCDLCVKPLLLPLFFYFAGQITRKPML